MKARSEQDQRPQRRRDDCRDDQGDRGQVGVVVVLGGDEYPEHDVRDRGQTAHSLIFVAHGAAPPRVSGAKSAARSCQIRLTNDPNDRIERHILRRPPGSQDAPTASTEPQSKIERRAPPRCLPPTRRLPATGERDKARLERLAREALAHRRARLRGPDGARRDRTAVLAEAEPFGVEEDDGLW